MPRVHRGEDQPVHHASPPIGDVGEHPEPAEVDLHLRARLAVGHRHCGLSAAEGQFCCGITIQRPILHHHTPATQQGVDVADVNPSFNHCRICSCSAAMVSHARLLPFGRCGRTSAITTAINSSVS